MAPCVIATRGSPQTPSNQKAAAKKGSCHEPLLLQQVSCLLCGTGVRGASLSETHVCEPIMGWIDQSTQQGGFDFSSFCSSSVYKASWTNGMQGGSKSKLRASHESTSRTVPCSDAYASSGACGLVGSAWGSERDRHTLTKALLGKRASSAPAKVRPAPTCGACAA